MTWSIVRTAPHGTPALIRRSATGSHSNAESALSNSCFSSSRWAFRSLLLAKRASSGRSGRPMRYTVWRMPVVADGQEDRRVAGGQRIVRVDVRMRVAVRLGRPAVEEPVRRMGMQQRESAIVQGRLDELAAVRFFRARAARSARRRRSRPVTMSTTGSPPAGDRPRLPIDAHDPGRSPARRVVAGSPPSGPSAPNPETRQRTRRGNVRERL